MARILTKEGPTAVGRPRQRRRLGIRWDRVISQGDLYIADLHHKLRHRVLVVSDTRFHALAGRALVAPEVMIEDGEVLAPWRVRVDAMTFAVDLLRSVPTTRLLERFDRAPAPAMNAVLRAIKNIT